MFLLLRHNRIDQQLQALVSPPFINIEPLGYLYMLWFQYQHRVIKIKVGGIATLPGV